MDAIPRHGKPSLQVPLTPGRTWGHAVRHDNATEKIGYMWAGKFRTVVELADEMRTASR